MDKKMEEMISLGAAYAVNCQPCMQVHKRKAIEAGVTELEMQAVIQVAEAVKVGAAIKSKDFAENLFGNIKEEKCCPVGSECCP